MIKRIFSTMANKPKLLVTRIPEEIPHESLALLEPQWVFVLFSNIYIEYQFFRKPVEDEFSTVETVKYFKYASCFESNLNVEVLTFRS